MKVIVAGSRDFNNYNLLANKLNAITAKMDKGSIEIVCGCAKGADALGRQYAKDYSIPYIEFPADWDTHGKSAGYIRNRAMAQYADALVAFWDGKSRGTKLMIELAKEMGLKYRVVMY